MCTPWRSGLEVSSTIDQTFTTTGSAPKYVYSSIKKSSYNFNSTIALIYFSRDQPRLHFPRAPAHQLCSQHIRPVTKSSNSRYSYPLPKLALVGGIAFRRTNSIPQTHYNLRSIAMAPDHPAALVAGRKSHSRDRARRIVLRCPLFSRRGRNGN